ncbi:MAG: redoxin family protein, partial [Actinobacteria bacterium]|nr:redoxin family protein [Actinomycetota bacterium]
AQPDTAIGQPAPVFSGLGFDGTPTEIRADGTARLIGFFAHWCPHCQRELPSTVDWLESNDLPDGVEVVAISTAVDEAAPNFPPSSWFAREDWPATVIVDSSSGALTEAFGLTGFPFWVAVNGDGTVAARVSGELDVAGFEALLATVTPGGAVTESAAGIRLVTANDGAQIQENPPANLVILDVRTPEEFEAGHLEGAILVDFYDDDFADQLAELDPDVPYLVYCRSGNRSGQTTPILASLGFDDVADIDGGIVAWTDAGLPVVTD